MADTATQLYDVQYNININLAQGAQQITTLTEKLAALQGQKEGVAVLTKNITTLQERLAALSATPVRIDTKTASTQLGDLALKARNVKNDIQAVLNFKPTVNPDSALATFNTIMRQFRRMKVEMERMGINIPTRTMGGMGGTAYGFKGANPNANATAYFTNSATETTEKASRSAINAWKKAGYKAQAAGTTTATNVVGGAGYSSYVYTGPTAPWGGIATPATAPMPATTPKPKAAKSPRVKADITTAQQQLDNLKAPVITITPTVDLGPAMDAIKALEGTKITLIPTITQAAINGVLKEKSGKLTITPTITHAAISNVLKERSGKLTITPIITQTSIDNLLKGRSGKLKIDTSLAQASLKAIQETYEALRAEISAGIRMGPITGGAFTAAPPGATTSAQAAIPPIPPVISTQPAGSTVPSSSNQPAAIPPPASSSTQPSKSVTQKQQTRVVQNGLAQMAKSTPYLPTTIRNLPPLPEMMLRGMAGRPLLGANPANLFPGLAGITNAVTRNGFIKTFGFTTPGVNAPLGLPLYSVANRGVMNLPATHPLFSQEAQLNRILSSWTPTTRYLASRVQHLGVPNSLFTPGATGMSQMLIPKTYDGGTMAAVQRFNALNGLWSSSGNLGYLGSRNMPALPHPAVSYLPGSGARVSTTLPDGSRISGETGAVWRHSPSMRYEAKPQWIPGQRQIGRVFHMPPRPTPPVTAAESMRASSPWGDMLSGTSRLWNGFASGAPVPPATSTATTPAVTSQEPGWISRIQSGVSRMRKVFARASSTSAEAVSLFNRHNELWRSSGNIGYLASRTVAPAVAAVGSGVRLATGLGQATTAVVSEKPSVGGRSPLQPLSTEGLPRTARSFYAGPANPMYKLFGPTPFVSNGGMAVGMLKGMGIAYGIGMIGSMIGDIVAQATEYDNTMKTVESILSSHTKDTNFAERFVSMQATVRRIGVQTKYKVTEVAEAAKFLAMAGLAVDEISTAMPSIANIALIGDTELGQTADMVTNIMTAYNMQAHQMAWASDIMTNTFTMTNTTLTEIAESFKYSASLLSAAGVSFEESTAAIGILGDAGIKGSQAGTTLRTIMANIVKPTKKQKKVWDAVGIRTVDENGEQRDLIDIFRDINKADLSVADFYGMFHKTAAQGAVALAHHVDKWNNVIQENFLSEGMAARLAEEKKNTLQGLWAQLTSMITEDGVTAFQPLHGLIRDSLKSAVQWLDTDEARNIFKETFRTVGQFGEMIVKGTGLIMKTLAPFKDYLLWFAKFQLMTWPFLSIFKFVKPMLTTLMALSGVGLRLTGVFRGLGAAIVGVGKAGVLSVLTASAAPLKQLFSFAGPGRGPILTHTQAGGINAKVIPFLPAVESEHLNRRGQEYLVQRQKEVAAGERDWSAFGKTKRFMGMASVAGKQLVGIGGTALGGLGTYMAMDNAINGGNPWITAGYTAAGIAAMAGPWGMLIGAVLGTTTYIIDLWNKSKDAVDKMNQELANMAGRYDNENSPVMRYLKYVFKQHSDINDVIRDRLSLYKEELEALGAAPTVKGDEWGGKQRKHYLELFDDMWNNALIDKRGLKVADLWNKAVDGKTHSSYAAGQLTWRLPDGTTKVMRGSEGLNIVAQEAATLMQMLNGEGNQKIFEAFSKNLGMAGSEDELRKIVAGFNSQYGPRAWVGKPEFADGNLSPSKAALLTMDEAISATTMRAYYSTVMPEIQQMVVARQEYLKGLNAGNLTESTLLANFAAISPSKESSALAAMARNGFDNYVTAAGFKNGSISSYYASNGQYVNEKAAATMLGKEMDKILRAISLEPEQVREMESVRILRKRAEIINEVARMTLNNVAISDELANKISSIFNGAEEAVKAASPKKITDIISAGVQDSIRLMRSDTVARMDTVLDTTKVKMRELSDSIAGVGGSVDSAMIKLYPWLSMRFTKYRQEPPYLTPRLQNFGTSLYPAPPGGFKPKPKPNLMGTLTKGAWTKDDDKKVDDALAEMKRLNKNRSALLGEDINTEDDENGTGGRSGGTGVTQDSYKSRYKDHSPIPKQVIVKIENLMNVDRIDLSKEDNRMVVDNIKEQLAQALLDAVSSSSASLAEQS